MKRPRLTCLALVAALALPLALARPAHASPYQFSMMMDDNQLLYGSYARQQHALARMKALGVTVVRVTVLWSNLTLDALSTRARRRTFNPMNPATYPRRNWDRYDNLVLTAPRYGITVYFDVTGPGPSWAMGRAPSSQRRSASTWMPNSQQFYKFVYALGKRYSGRYRKEDSHRPTLPRVRVWSIWNEPNQGGWLSPQSYYSPIAHAVIPYAPILYRQLYFSAHKALVDTGHATDAILIGETAPLGRGSASARNPLTPKVFIRELFCLNGHGTRYSGAQAQARDCSIFSRLGPLQTSGWSHHPYTRKAPPTSRPPVPDDIVLSNLGDLAAMLDQAAATTGDIAPNLPIFITEFGFETFPPDPFYGVPLAKQALWINLADFLTFLNPRVFGMTQFLLQDVPPDAHARRGSKSYWHNTYQSGLLFDTGHPKPAYSAYRLPIVVYKAGTDAATGKRFLAFWGQLRFLAHLATPTTAQLEYRPSGSSRWQSLGPPTFAGPVEFLAGEVDDPGPGQVRLTWKAHMPPYIVHSMPVGVPAG